MKKSLVLKIVLAAIMASLAIVLEKFSIPLGDGNFKITLYGLPLLFSGIMFGPIVGLLAGTVVGFVAQLTSPWGLTPTTPLWMLAPIIWGGLSGLISKLFRKKDIRFTDINIITTVIVTSLTVSLVNSLVSFLELKITGYGEVQTFVTIVIRCSISFGLCVPYSIILYFLCNRLKHLSWKNPKLTNIEPKENQ